MTFCLETTIVKPETDTPIDNAVILLHGYGGDGKDISMLTLNWKRFLPNTIFLCPSGHEKCAISPTGRQWFDLTKDDSKYILEQSKKAEEKIQEFISEVKNKYKLKNSQICLSGFSQGCMMAINLGLTSKEKFNCIVGFSGKIINQDDLNVLHLMVQHTRVTFDYNPTTNDLIFDTHAAPSDKWQEDIVVDGEDTGGQIVRTCLQLAVQISGGRQTLGGAPPLLEIPSKDKACMLYVQASMYTLEIGGSFMIHGGSPLNPDAPTPENYHHIFAMLKKFLGISFRLDDASTSSSITSSATLSPSKFVLTREKDVQPTVNPSEFVSEIPLTYMMMDQLLMGLCLQQQLPTAEKERKIIQLVCDYNKDYHVNAMVKMLRLLHYDVVDKRVGGLRKISIQLRGR